MGTPVIIKMLNATHPEESFTTFRPLNTIMLQEIQSAVNELFDQLGGESLLKPSGEVYIKPNAVDAQPYSHTRVEVLEAIINYWQNVGAKNIFLFENSTQGNYTRLVYRGTGYKKLCQKTGAIPVYLDEGNFMRD